MNLATFVQACGSMFGLYVLWEQFWVFEYFGFVQVD